MISDRAIAEVAALQESRRREYVAERKRAEQRDQLAGIIEGETGMAFTSKTAADRILSAGYRPPARIVEDTDDFDALRSGVILRVTNGTTASVWRKVGRQWESTEIGTGELCDSIDLEDFCRDEDATATVIFEPEETGQ